jgi:hypothetical protein
MRRICLRLPSTLSNRLKVSEQAGLVIVRSADADVCAMTARFRWWSG